jgi:hypothetical protein
MARPDVISEQLKEFLRGGQRDIRWLARVVHVPRRRGGVVATGRFGGLQIER